MSGTFPEIIVYPAKNGRPEIQLRVEGGTVWLSDDIKSLKEAEERLFKKPEGEN